MNDRLVARAKRFGTKSKPVESKARPSTARGKDPLEPDEVAAAMEMARQDRIDRDIRAYAERKRAAT